MQECATSDHFFSTLEAEWIMYHNDVCRNSQFTLLDVYIGEKIHVLITKTVFRIQNKQEIKIG